MTFETDLQAAQASGRPFSVMVDLTAKTRTVAYLTDEELAARAERHDAADAASAPAMLERKRAEALKALDDARLAAAVADPNAPQAVKDYAALAQR